MATSTTAPALRTATSPPVSPVLLSVAVVARRCGASARSVRRWIASGDLAVHRLGRSVRVADVDLGRFLAARRTLGQASPVAPRKAAVGRPKGRS